MNQDDYHAAIYEAEEYMGGPATHRKETTQTANPAQKGLNAARQVAQWHLGDPTWADRIIGAYINPEAGLDRLRGEKGDGMN